MGSLWLLVIYFLSYTHSEIISGCLVDAVALHIRLADHVATVGVRADTTKWVQRHVAATVRDI